MQGWRIGGDLWLRYPLGGGLTLPVLVRADYRTRTRDGDGPGWGGNAGYTYDYGHKQEDLAITVGGGVDKELNKGTRIAGGVYYSYLQGREAFSFNWFYVDPFSGPVWERYDTAYPDTIEHQVLVRLAGEHELSPLVVLRAGINFFYGWVDSQYKNVMDNWLGSSYVTEISGPGSHWGIGASLGGTIKVKPLTLEPFVAGGWEQLKEKRDGELFVNGVLTSLYDDRLTRNAWHIGGGLSILFDVP